jgi:hypothetical protein
MKNTAIASTCNSMKWTAKRPARPGDASDALRPSLMDVLFQRLSGVYLGSWKTYFPSQSAVDNWATTWAEAFEEDRITPDEIAIGIRNMRQMYVDWAPNLPQFLKACRPKLDPMAALDEAMRQMRARQECKDIWSHPAIFWAAVEVTEHDMLNRTPADLQPRFTRALQALLNNPETIKPVPEAAKRLPPPPVQTSQEGTAALNALKAGLAKYRAKQPNDGEGVAA